MIGAADGFEDVLEQTTEDRHFGALALRFPFLFADEAPGQEAERAWGAEGGRVASLDASVGEGNGKLGADSDIDLLVEFEPGRTPGLLGIARLELDLAEMLGRPVDLRTLADLSRYFRDDVAAEARTLYDAA